MLGTNPDAWGVWTRHDAERVPAGRFLDDVAAAGYRAVEIGPSGYLPTAPGPLREALAARGLSLSAGYVPRLSPDRSRRRAVLDVTRSVGALAGGAGAPYLVVLAGMYRDAAGRPLQPRDLDDDAWRALVEEIDAVAHVAREELGLRVAFHPHIDSLIETPAQIDRLLHDASDDVELCLDTGQIAYRGGDPVAVARAWAGRVSIVHIRDLDPAPTAAARCADLPFAAIVDAGVLCDPGTGLVDLAALATELAVQGFDGPVTVERSLLGASPEAALAAAERARTALEAVGLVPPAPAT